MRFIAFSNDQDQPALGVRIGQGLVDITVLGPALASMSIYILMALVLALRPQGLFPVKHG